MRTVRSRVRIVPGLLVCAALLCACRTPGNSSAIPEEPRPIEIDVGALRFDALAAGPEDGELVLLLHGFPQTSASFRHQIPALAAAGYRVVAPDQRGYSPGARPAGVEAYATPRLVEDVIGLADALGAETFHVVGHDWGAAVAWFTALAHPERVASLVAISVPHPYAFSAALADPNGEQARMSGYMQTLRAENAEELLLANDAAMLRAVFDGSGSSPEEIQVYVDALGTPKALGAALNWYRAMGVAAPWGTLTPIRMPTMFVWSTEDRALGRTGAELTADFVEGPYRFEVLEGVSHWVPEQAASTLAALLLEHLASLDAGP